MRHRFPNQLPLSCWALDCLALQGLHGEKLGFNHIGDFNLEKIKKAVRIIQDYGIDIFGFFIVGFDEDTHDTFRQTLEFCQQTKIIPMINILSPLPGTPLYKQFESEGRFQPDLDWDKFMRDKLVFKHPSMTGGEIKRSGDTVAYRGSPDPKERK